LLHRNLRHWSVGCQAATAGRWAPSRSGARSRQPVRLEAVARAGIITWSCARGPEPGAGHGCFCSPSGGTARLIQNRVQTLAFAVTAILMIAPAVAGTPLYLSANPPKAQIDFGSKPLARARGSRSVPWRPLPDAAAEQPVLLHDKGHPPDRAGAGNCAENPVRQCCALKPSRKSELLPLC
jgi:hypothetical protein